MVNKRRLWTSLSPQQYLAIMCSEISNASFLIQLCGVSLLTSPETERPIHPKCVSILSCWRHLSQRGAVQTSHSATVSSCRHSPHMLREDVPLPVMSTVSYLGILRGKSNIKCFYFKTQHLLLTFHHSFNLLICWIGITSRNLVLIGLRPSFKCRWFLCRCEWN